MQVAERPGNGIWTHSISASPRNRDGLIAGNRFEELARDAIQVGHATNVRVETRGNRIRDNQISGFGMETACIVAAPGVFLGGNEIGPNRCTGQRPSVAGVGR